MSTQGDIVRVPSSSDSCNIDSQGGRGRSSRNLCCRNSSNEPTGQLTGSTALTKHQESKTGVKLSSRKGPGTINGLTDSIREIKSSLAL